MSLVCFNKEKNQNFFDLIKKYRFQLSDSSVTLTDIHQMADHLALTLHESLPCGDAQEEMSSFLQEISHAEDQRREEDQTHLFYIHQLGFEIKQLRLQIDTLVPSEIETKLNDLWAWYESLKERACFQSDFFSQEMQYLQLMLEDLTFFFHFPKADLIKSSDHLKRIQDFFFHKISTCPFEKDVIDPYLFRKTKKRIEDFDLNQDRFFLTQVFLEYLYDTMG